jgi:hypothetical protein
VKPSRVDLHARFIAARLRLRPEGRIVLRRVLARRALVPKPVTAPGANSDGAVILDQSCPMRDMLKQRG